MAKFVDKVKVNLQAGKGGDGMISFRREAHVDRGGPDGGDGGNGGNIYFIGDLGKNTLLSFYSQKHIVADDGVKGGPKNLYGANAKDTYIKVPIGTLVYKDGNLVADVIEPNVPYLVAKGGKGGRGNNKFKTSKNTAPRIAENGLPGEKYEAEIVLKILSDVGLVGKPSAGKSTILNALSNTKAKVAEYSFTTLVPQLGMVKYFENSFTVADLPGLIEGASLGKGLGFQFLQHIERCRVIVHVIDFGSENKNPIQDYELINEELKSYNLKLEQKAQLVVANKNDLPTFEKHFNEFKEKYPNVKIVSISALEHNNIQNLIKSIWEVLEQEILKPIEEDTTEKVKIIEFEPDYEIKMLYQGHFIVTGKKVKELVDKIPLNTHDNLIRFNNILKKIGVWDELLKMEIQRGDTVEIYDLQLEWEDQ